MNQVSSKALLWYHWCHSLYGSANRHIYFSEVLIQSSGSTSERILLEFHEATEIDNILTVWSITLSVLSEALHERVVQNMKIMISKFWDLQTWSDKLLSLIPVASRPMCSRYGEFSSRKSIHPICQLEASWKYWIVEFFFLYPRITCFTPRCPEWIGQLSNSFYDMIITQNMIYTISTS